MPITSISQSGLPHHSNMGSTPPRNEFLGFIDRIQSVFPNKIAPSYLRGAMQGEGVVATYNKENDENHLYSLNAQTCVIATLYANDNKKGAVIHFDHNISSLVDEAISAAFHQMKAGDNRNVTSTLSGGVWFMGGQSVGDAVKESLRKNGVDPTWDQWSFSPCWQHNYGVILNLEDGKVDVFEHSTYAANEFYEPLLRESGGAINPENIRARYFMDRCRSAAICEKNEKLEFVNRTGPVTSEDIHRSRIRIHEATGSRFRM